MEIYKLKITCPVGCGEFESIPDPDTNPCHSDLERHLKTQHDPGMMMVHLLRKIHNMIEDWEKNSHPLEEITAEAIPAVLKSLLEDKK